MNTQQSWLVLWRAGRNTAEIARELKLEECTVDSAISRLMSEKYLKRKKPFSKETA